MNDTRVGQREHCNTTIVVHMRSSASGFIGSSGLRIAMLSTIWAPRAGGIISDAPDASQCDAFGEKPGRNWSDPESRFTQCLSSRQPTVEAPELHDPGSGRVWAALQCFVKATCSGDGIRSRIALKARRPIAKTKAASSPMAHRMVASPERKASRSSARSVFVARSSRSSVAAWRSTFACASACWRSTPAASRARAAARGVE